MPAHYISCHSCGLELRLPPLKPGKAAFCPRCGHPLARVEANPFLLPPALALASLIMLAVVVIVMILYGMRFEAVINELFRWLLSLL